MSPFNHFEQLYKTYCYLVGMMGGQLLKKFRTRLFLIQFYSSISRFGDKTPLKKINYKVFMSLIFLAIGSSENAWKSWKTALYFVPSKLCTVRKWLQFFSGTFGNRVESFQYHYWVWLRPETSFCTIFYCEKIKYWHFNTQYCRSTKNWNFDFLRKKV